MVETRPKSPGNGDHRVRCLIWVPGGYDAPLELLEGLRQRNTVVKEVRDAPGIMAALVPPQRGRRDSRPQVVVIVEPGVLRDAQRLIAAVQRYHPHVKLWKYEFTPAPGNVALQPIVGKPEAVQVRSIREESVQRGSPAAASPAMKVPVSQPPEVVEVPQAADEAEQVDQPLLSAEELAMLLGDGDTEHGWEKT